VVVCVRSPAGLLVGFTWGRTAPGPLGAFEPGAFAVSACTVSGRHGSVSVPHHLDRLGELAETGNLLRQIE